MTTTFPIYRIIIQYPSKRIRNIFASEDINDASFIADVLRDYYSRFGCFNFNKPRVRIEYTVCIAYPEKDIIIIDGTEWVLSILKQKLIKPDYATLLKNLGEKPLDNRIYYSCLRRLSGPVHYEYSILV